MFNLSLAKGSRVRRCMAMLVVSASFTSILGAGALALPQGASAAAICRSQGLILTPFGGEVGLQNTNCAESNGGGYELAYWAVQPPHSGTLAGCYHIQQTDNGYTMANSGEYCDPGVPGAFYPSTPYGGWIYHPYWGTYCSKVWVNQGSGHFSQAVPEVCFYTDGYQ